MVGGCRCRRLHSSQAYVFVVALTLVDFFFQPISVFNVFERSEKKIFAIVCVILSHTIGGVTSSGDKRKLALLRSK